MLGVHACKCALPMEPVAQVFWCWFGGVQKGTKNRIQFQHQKKVTKVDFVEQMECSKNIVIPVVFSLF